MPKVNFMPELDSKAHNMVLSVINHNGTQNENIHEFFKYANDKKQQSQALMSYYTKLNSLRNSEMNNENYDTINNVEKIIDKFVGSDKDIKTEADKFVKTLNENYPRSMGKRISILAQGAVKSDSTVRTSFGKKFMVKMNLLFDKIVEFSKPVE